LTLRGGENNLTWNHLALPLQLRRDRIDLLHSPSYTLPLWRGRPAVVTIHDVSYERHPEWFPPKARLFNRVFSRFAARVAAVVLTDSEFSRQEILDVYRVPPERVVAIPLAAGSQYRPPEDHTAAERVRARYGLGAPLILYVGNVIPRRNVPLLVAAFAQVCRERAAHLAVVNAGPQAQAQLAVLARECGVVGDVTCLDYVPDEDLVALYHAAAAFVWLSVYEGFGLPPLEALACGTPTLVANASCLPEVVGDAALRVDPHDPAAVAGALTQLLTDDALASDLRARGPGRAAEFSWRRTAEETLAVYRRVVQA
jgi:glycosyltransferase involved in cell wall biosynthesis